MEEIKKDTPKEISSMDRILESTLSKELGGLVSKSGSFLL